MKKLKIIKIGGNIIDDKKCLDSFLKKFATIKGCKILIHGGGILATKVAKEMNIPVQMVAGRRITNQATLDVITMVYAGKINKNIITKLQSFGCNSVGFSGADGNTIISVKRPVKKVDYGFVGDVKSVQINVSNLLLQAGVTPVFCAITHTKEGQLLNTNADTIAAAMAIAFSNIYETELYFCFDKNGVLKDVENENSVIKTINKNKYKQLIEEGVISDGMLPKLNNCFYAISNNVFKVSIGKPSMLFNKKSVHTSIKV